MVRTHTHTILSINLGKVRSLGFRVRHLVWMVKVRVRGNALCQ